MILLASASPRRRELLERITPDFRVEVSDVDEQTAERDPEAVVRELALRKAAAVAQSHPQDAVLGCDTVVYAHGQILGKPHDLADAARMMRLLAGGEHLVYTGVALVQGGRRLVRSDCTRVEMTAVSEAELSCYLAQEDVLDKAGAYAIQGGASKFIRRIDGSCTGVMGLPVELVYHMLLEFGMPLAAGCPEDAPRT